MQTTGIHHITAIAGDAQANLDFYSNLLGVRLVKKTVNFDAPEVYHLYYGDAAGSPGTILTFFPWGEIRPGQLGAGQATAIGFAIPTASLDFWQARLDREGVPTAEPEVRFGEPVVRFVDPDGLPLELVARDVPARTELWERGPVPPEHQIRGFAGVTLLEARRAPTEALLTGQLGYQQVAGAGDRVRYRARGAGPGETIDILEVPVRRPGIVAAGSIHHIAFRAVDDADQLAAHAALTSAGFSVTPVRDRQYFHSIYFHEPGGVLFEIATDPPGFLIDETPETLGSALKLPPWLERNRADLERALPPLRASV